MCQIPKKNCTMPAPPPHPPGKFFFAQNTFNLIFLGFKVSSEGFLNRSYFLKYVVLKNRKLSRKLTTNGWDTLYVIHFSI